MDYTNYIRTHLGRFSSLRKILLPISQYLRNRKLKEMNENFHSHATTVFKDITNVLFPEIQFWPEFGTLLGFYRDKGFMSHDFDFDFGAYSKEAPIIREKLQKKGFVIEHEYEGIGHSEIHEITFSYLGVFIDFFFFNEEEDAMTCYTFHPEKFYINEEKNTYKIKPFYFPKFKLEKKEIMGIPYYSPTNIHEHLTYAYGPSYMIPDPNFKSIHFDYLENIKGYHKK